MTDGNDERQKTGFLELVVGDGHGWYVKYSNGTVPLPLDTPQQGGWVLESFLNKDAAMTFALEKLNAGYLGVGLGTLPGAAAPEEVTTADLWSYSMGSMSRM